MRVLIVDDNVLTRNMIKDILQYMLHQVAGEAGNGDEAIKAFKELSPDLVLLDLIMPGKPGLEVLEELRSINPAAKIVMVTAVQQDEINKKLFEKGAAAILYKPFSHGELEAVLKQVA
ncbi:MAG: response regulator [Elusimicrobiota bacterium]